MKHARTDSSTGSGARPGDAFPEIVSGGEWEEARSALLVKEKAHTREQDALAAERRRLPRLLHIHR